MTDERSSTEPTVSPEPKAAIAEASGALKDAADRVADAVDAGRRPGTPLDVLSRVAREAPLASLLVAFLLGVAFAGRR